MVTNHAVAVPIASVRSPTPISSSTVWCSARGSTVLTRCGQMLSVGVRARMAMVTTGRSMMPRINAAVMVQAGDTERRARQLAMARGTPTMPRMTS